MVLGVVTLRRSDLWSGKLRLEESSVSASASPSPRLSLEVTQQVPAELCPWDSRHLSPHTALRAGNPRPGRPEPSCKPK